MTLICYFAELGIGISDLLMTTSGCGDWGYLPSVGPLGEQPLSFKPSRLVRKVAKLSVGGITFSLLIAGNVQHAQEFLRVAQELASGDLSPGPLRVPLDRKQLMSILYHATRFGNASGKTDLSVIGLRGVEAGGVSARRLDLTYFGETLIAGSGAQHVETYLRDIDTEYSKVFSDHTTLDRAFRTAHYLPLQLLVADRGSPSPTLREGVGGFYEVLIAVERRGLVPEGVGGLRIIADLHEDPKSGLRVRGLWWHVSIDDDLTVVSAPCEDLALSPGQTVLIPTERLSAQCFGPFARPTLPRQPTSSGELLPRIARSRIHSWSMVLPGSPQRVMMSIAPRQTSIFRIDWSKTGLNLTLVKERYGVFVKNFPSREIILS